MSAPTIALLVNAFSSNKVEGFVIMKSAGLIILLPIAAMFVFNWTELFLGIIPGFWPARMISMSLLPTDFFMPQYLYFTFGILVNAIYIIFFYRLFKKRI
jgi:fluoroquinolone transport system permease protein